MLLAASTALATDRLAYNKLFKYMVIMSLVLSFIHVLVAFTPLYYILALDLLNVPESLVEPGKLGLRIMTPWTFMIAWRRLNQGTMIKYGNSKAIAIGTLIRLFSLIIILAFGRWYTNLSGIFVGSLAVAIAVTMEALYAGKAVQKILKESLPKTSNNAPINRG